MDEGTKMVRAARLDADGVYQGMDELPEGELTPLHLPQIDECDLPPGQYRWSEAQGAFVPVGPPELRLEPGALTAIYYGFRAVQASGIALPPETTAWLDQFATTWDGQ